MKVDQFERTARSGGAGRTGKHAEVRQLEPFVQGVEVTVDGAARDADVLDLREEAEGLLGMSGREELVVPREAESKASGHATLLDGLSRKLIDLLAAGDGYRPPKDRLRQLHPLLRDMAALKDVAAATDVVVLGMRRVGEVEDVEDELGGEGRNG